MRKVSLQTRLAQDRDATEPLEIVLVRITHPEIDEPILLSSDNTEILSEEPRSWGTRSFWRQGAAAEPGEFQFLAMSIGMPEDQDDASGSGNLVFANFSRKIAQALQATTRQASLDLCVVTDADTDRPEAEFVGLKVISVEGNAAEFTLTFSRDPVSAEPWPSGRMTKQRFPGMHR